MLKWRGRYEQSGVDGLDDDPRPGRAAVIDEVAVLAETLADKGRPPAHLGVTHWSTRLMADRLGISFASVARIWRKWGIQPHRVETFKFHEMFRALNGVVAEVLSGRTHHGMMPDRPNPHAIDLHDEVARAIRQGDEAAAERAMRAIIDEAAGAVQQEFSDDSSNR